MGAMGLQYDPATGLPIRNVMAPSAPINTTYAAPNTPSALPGALSKAAGYAGAGLTALNVVAPTLLAGTALASAPFTLGLSLVPLAVMELSKIREGARTADEFVQKYQDKFYNDILKPIAQLKETDPQAAAQQLAPAWSEFLRQADIFAAENPTHAKVVSQMLNQTPELTNTVTDMLKPLGVTAFDPSFMAGKDFASSNNGPSALAAAAPAILAGGAYAAGQIFGGGGNSNPATSNPPIDMGDNPAGVQIPNVGSTPATTAPVSPTATQSIFGKIAPLALGAASVAGNIYSANTQADAANNTTALQTAAAEKAAQLQADTAKAALAQQQSQFDITQANQAPWQAAGKSALDMLMGTGDGSLTNLTKPFTEQFNFTQDDLLKDPGYLRRLQDTQQALERSASAKGGIFTPGASAAIANKVGAQASDEYNAAYNRAYQQYLSDYNIFTGNQTNAFNKEASVAGLGQTANSAVQQAGQNLATTSTNTAQNSTTSINDLLTSLANAQGKNSQTAATATSGGVTNSIDDITSLIQNYINNKAKAA
jgi:hypothetical protein